jgi:hypothetical protein
VSSSSTKLANAIATTDPAGQHAAPEPANQDGSETSGPSVTLLPRRNPGSSGITEVPAPPAEQRPRRHRRKLATPWWENEQQSKRSPEPKPAPANTPAVSDTSAFFAARSQGAADRADAAAVKPANPPAGASISPLPTIPQGPKGPPAPADDDVIYRRMLTEMLGDPHDLMNSPDLDWQSVWDRGWSLAAAAEDRPVESHTAEHGLPVRTPGARLVPGGANGTGLAEPDRTQEDQGSLVGSNGASPSGRRPQHAAAARDPEAVRASFSSHFGAVRYARSHARDTNEGAEQE